MRKTAIIDGKEYEIVKPDAIIDIGVSTAKCPYCGAQLYVQFEEWEDLENGYWQVSDCGVGMECTAEPENIDSNEWNAWLRRHTRMPYVYWLPVQERVTKWLQEKYRIVP